MKEAAGEANMTVVTIILIAVVLGVGTLIVNNIMRNVNRNSACTSAGGMWVNNACGTGCTQDASGNTTCTGTLTCSHNPASGGWDCR